MISENEIANVYNVSRTPIKTAFMRLKGENYVDVVPQRGTFVTPLDMKYVKDAIYMRSILENDVCERILQSDRYNEVIAILEKNIKKQFELVESSNIDPSDFYNVDNDFHLALFWAMDQSEMWYIIQYCQVYYTRFRMLDYSVATRYSQLATEHERILIALKSKSKENLKPAVFDHLHGAFNTLADRIETDFKQYFI